MTGKTVEHYAILAKIGEGSPPSFPAKSLANFGEVRPKPSVRRISR